MADNGAMVLSPADRDMMIRTVIGEAGNDPSAAGVAAVIANRMRKYGQSATQVVLAPNQFEPWSTRRDELMSYAPTSRPYQNAAAIVDGILSGKTPDPTNGAIAFYAPVAQKALGRPTPAWDNGTGVDIGGHRFFGGQPVAQTDWLGQSIGKPSQVATVSPSAASPDASANSVVASPAPAASGSTDWLAHSAGIAPPPTTQAPAVSALSGKATPAPPPGSYPLGDPRNQGLLPFDRRSDAPIPATAPTTVDPYDSISTQLATAARLAGGYALSQGAGVLPAIGQDFASGANLVGSGVNAMRNGSPFMGAVAAGVGALGMGTSMVSGPVRKLVEEPVTDMTGNPTAGEIAGMGASAVGGGFLGKGVSALSRGLGDATIGVLDPETAQLAQVARQQFGIPVNAGQMSPSPGIRFASSALNRLPMSGAEGDIAAQQGAFNRAVANTIGESADKLTPDVMNAARTRIGGYYDKVAANTNLNVDPQFVQDIHDTLNDASQVLPRDQAAPLLKQAQNILSKIDPNTKSISGATYQALTNQGAPLDRLIDSADPTVGYYANGIKKALDGALQRSATPEDQALLKTADRQWWALKTIQPIVAKAPTGDISPALLAGRVNASTGNAMAFGGGGDLGTLARIGQRFLKEPPSSGTSERASVLATLGKVGGLGANAVGAAALGVNAGMSPTEMALTAAGVPASLLAGRGVGSALRSNWLANALINRSVGTSPPVSLAPWAAAGVLGDIQARNALTTP
jgi:hypothetical protein